MIGLATSYLPLNASLRIQKLQFASAPGSHTHEESNLTTLKMSFYEACQTCHFMKDAKHAILWNMVNPWAQQVHRAQKHAKHSKHEKLANTPSTWARQARKVGKVREHTSTPFSRLYGSRDFKIRSCCLIYFSAVSASVDFLVCYLIDFKIILIEKISW